MLKRPTSASAVRRPSAVQDADEVFGKSPREPPLEHVGAPKHVSRPTSAQPRRPSLEEVLSGSKKGTFARAASLSLISAPAPPKQLPAAPAPAPPKVGKTLERSPSAPKSLPPAPKPLSDQVKPEPQHPKEERTMPLKAPEPPTVEAAAPKPHTVEAAAPKPHTVEAAAPKPHTAEAAAPKPHTAEAAAPKPQTLEAAAPKPPTVEAAAPKPPTAEAAIPEPPEAPPTESLQTDEAATKEPSQPVEPKRVMALLPPAPLPPAPIPTTSAPPPPPKTGSPSRKKLSMAPLPPELMPETPMAKHGKAAAPAGYPQMPKAGDAPAAPVAPTAGYPSREVPSRPTPQINAGLPQARRQRAELVSNLQYLCRLFLETREQLYAAHEGTETEVVGNRFHYKIFRGHGPSSGWISTKLKGKQLLIPADVRDTGRFLNSTAPIPELFYVQPSEKHGTFREIRGTMDQLEQEVSQHLKDVEKTGKDDWEAFQGLLEDLLHLAWRRENRQRVVLFLGKKLQSCSQNAALKDAARIICEHLCLVSWASSMVDVEYYRFRDSTSPLVLLCGFGGSHLDDLQPAIEHWTSKGFGVLAFGPARVGREDMLDLIHSKLLELCVGRSVVESPSIALKCIIADGAGLLPHEDVEIDPLDKDPLEPVQVDSDDAQVQKNLMHTALAFFTGCGLNMLMNFGACQAFHEEPANSFGKTLVMLGNSGQLTAKLTGAPRGPLVSLWPLLTSMPTLLVASKGDRVVPLERSTALEKWLKKLPERQVAISERWTNEDILGDGTAVKTLILEKALHCKAMISHAAEYWEAIDALDTLGQPHGTMPKPLIRLLRSFGRRALYGRRRSPYGRRSFALFQQACTGHEGRGFVLGAVPQVLRLMDRLVEEGRRTMSDAVEDGGDDPWLDGMPEEVPETKGKGLPDWERLDGILSETPNLDSLHVEADAFLAETSMPKPLCLSKAAEVAEPEASQPESGSFAPRGRRPAKVEGEDVSTQDAKHGRRLFAPVAPYYSSDPALLLKVAKAPLPNLDSLVNALVPGAEITTEGLLLQLADEELVVMAYALEQIAEAASKRLVKDLEVRDELRSTCMHRREYLQLLEGALSRK
eukprot:symbB.v1.2.032111.t3/scaffold3804.1/size50051/2